MSLSHTLPSSRGAHVFALLSLIFAVALGARPPLALATGSALSAPSPMALNPRKVIAAAEALPPGGINELIPVRIGGIPQWISIRGADRSNPILLFISGGPGDPMMPESWTFQRPWEDFCKVSGNPVLELMSMSV